MRAAIYARYSMTFSSIAAAILLTVLSAQAAHAACAWILWQEMTTVPESPGTWGWKPQTAVESMKKCETLLRVYLQTSYESWPDVGKNVLKKQMGRRGEAAGSFQVTTKDNKGNIYFINTRYVCLPDTIDPRKPK
jgi:hypothetical protein